MSCHSLSDILSTMLSLVIPALFIRIEILTSLDSISCQNVSLELGEFKSSSKPSIPLSFKLFIPDEVVAVPSTL